MKKALMLIAFVLVSRIMTAATNPCIASQQTGSTADAQIRACVTALSPDGGVIDARDYGATTQTWASSVVLGSTAQPLEPIVLVLNPSTLFKVTESDGGNALLIEPRSSVVAFGEAHIGPISGGLATFGFTTASTANLNSVIKCDPSDGGLSRCRVDGISVYAGAGNATYRIDLESPTDATQVQNTQLFCGSQMSYCLYVNSGQATL